MRAGGYALSLLSVPLNVHVLRTLEEEPRSLTDLRRAVGSPPQTTMRGNLRTLSRLEIVERSRQNEFPGSVDCELGPAGRELLTVAAALEGWLAAAPDGPIELGSVAAKSTIKALVGGWSSTIVRALAARPLSLTELNRLISELNYPSLERRLGALRLAGLIEACSSRARGTPYTVTDWLRQGIGPIAAAARWERRRARDEAPPITRIDTEAALLLTVPALSLPAELSGTCRLAVELAGGGSSDFAGVLVEVEEGRVISCVTRLRGEAGAWASGSTPAWFQATLDGEADRLEIGGDCHLAMALIEGLNGAMARARQRL